MMTQKVKETIVENQREGFVKSDRNCREQKDILQQGKKFIDITQKTIDDAKEHSNESLILSATNCLNEQLILVNQISVMIFNYERLRNRK